MSDKKILHLLFHPKTSESKVNKFLFENLRGKVSKQKDMYSLYPNFEFDVEQEQKDLLEADAIVLEFPLYWYSAPALCKQWFDSVWTFGFAYWYGDPSHNQLAGKRFQIITSAGGKEEAYIAGGNNNYTISELLRPMQQVANKAHMVYLPPMCLYGAMYADEAKLDAFANEAAERIGLIASGKM